MSKDSERPALRLTGDERKSIYAIWSRSGKRVIVTVGQSQVELTPEQAKRLAAFFEAGPDGD